MRERALTFGPASLVGILTQPDPHKAIPGAPAMIILNSGILHRTGASRIYVQIARALAEAGFTTFRFDFSGVGDSEVRKDSIPILERFTQETVEAMDYVASVSGAEQFMVGGLCSGGDGAYWAGLKDERVAGVWQIDAFTYPTLGFYRRKLFTKLLNPGSWAHSVKVRLTPPDETEGRDDESFVKPEYRRVFPPQEEVGEGLGSLLERGTSLYFLFTGGAEDYSYETQHEEAFPELKLRQRAQLRFIADCSHTVTNLDHQEILVSDLVDWSQAILARSDKSEQIA